MYTEKQITFTVTVNYSTDNENTDINDEINLRDLSDLLFDAIERERQNGALTGDSTLSANWIAINC